MTEAPEAGSGITLQSRVELRPLEMRANGDEWIVGSVEAGEFIAVPPVAARIVELLGGALTVGEVQSRLAAETGQLLAVGDFIAALDEAGFVSCIDGKARRDLPVARPSFPWLKPAHASFLLNPAVPFIAAALLVAALTALAFKHQATLSYRTIIWTRYPGLAIAVTAAFGWLIIFLHELGHLVTARAAGAPARITLGTRLRFLVAQTDVSGVWAAPRRIRMVVYLAGLCIDCSIAVTCLVIINYVHPAGVAGHLIALASVEAFLMLPPQFMVFMRTDLYFVLQDLTKSPNLYADGLEYLRSRAEAAAGYFRADRNSARPAPRRTPDPPRWVRIYAIAVLVGSAVCLVTEFTVSLPAFIVLVVNGFRELHSGLAEAADGAAAIAVVGGVQYLWMRSWCQRHGSRVARRIRRVDG